MKAETQGGQNAWGIDPTHTTVVFSVANLFLFKVNGTFSEVTGTLVLDDDDVSRSSVVATIKVDSLKTGNLRRDAHLRAGDFLDVDHYPDIRFQSLQVRPGTDRDMLDVVGTLKIKESDREVVLSVGAVDRSCSPHGEEVVYFTAVTELDRFDFGIKYGRGVIGRKLKVVINIQALKQK